MKRFFLWAFIAFFGSSLSQAQVFKGMLLGGFNLTQVEGDEVYGFNRLGANVGAGVFLPIDNKWGVSLEALFTQKGAYQGDQYLQYDSLGERVTGSYDLRLDYVEIPVLAHFTDRNRITAGIGFSYSRLIGVTEKEHGKLIETTTVNNGPYSKSDYALLGDLRVKLYPSILLNFRYSYSLSSIRTRDFYNLTGAFLRTREQFNSTLTLRLIWMFNDGGLTLSNVNKANNVTEE